MHEGLVSLVLGLPGIPAAAEDVMISRDIALAEATGGRLHVMHVSTANGIDILRRAKARGVRVTAEATPHHFTLTDECLRTFDANFKMNPPLRGREHVEAVIAGLADGTIDAVASDHAPHAQEKKMQELDQAPFGIVGLETSLALVITKLIEPGHLDWPTAIRKMSLNPARILGIPKGTLAIGADGRRDDHRPQGPLDGRSRQVPLEEHKHALCRHGVDRPRRRGDRRRPGEIPEIVVSGQWSVASKTSIQAVRRGRYGCTNHWPLTTMFLLIDGYNLLHATGIAGRGSGPGGFERSRLALLNFLAASIDPADLAHTTVVFDAREAPPGLPRMVEHGGLTVRFAAKYESADDLIVELIQAASAPRRLVVVSSDHVIQRAARRRRAKAVDSDVWYAELIRARRERVETVADAPARPAVPLLAEDVSYWLRQFGGESALSEFLARESSGQPEVEEHPPQEQPDDRARRRKTLPVRGRPAGQPLSARLWRGFIAGPLIA